MNNKNKILIISMISTIMLSGCKSEIDKKENISDLINKKKQSGYSVAKKITELNSYESVNYEAFEKKSPFEKYFDKKHLKSKTSTFKPDLDREKEILEKFDLTQLRITGILDNKKEKSVIIFDGKKNHIVRLGNYLGNNFGKIIQINKRSIIIQEIVKEDGINSWVDKKVEMKMQESLE